MTDNCFPYTGDPIGEPNHYEPFPYTMTFPQPAVYTLDDAVREYLAEIVGQRGRLRIHDETMFSDVKILVATKDFVKFETADEVVYRVGPYTFAAKLQ